VLRKFPYPFRNMLSILSDADTNDKDKFEGTHRFMNTFADCGKMGRGVGLDIGDTFFMGKVGQQYKTPIPEKEWFYWNSKDSLEIAAQPMRKYIKTGWIDIPHTFFNYRDKSAYSREQAVNAAREWERIGYRPLAWVDHADCPWNIMSFYENKLIAPAKPGDCEIFVDSKITDTENTIIFPTTGECVTLKELNQSVRPYSLLIEGRLKNAYPKGEYLTVRRNMKSCGSDPNSEFYCADLALKSGIKAFWAPIPRQINIKTLRGNFGFETCLIPKRLPDNRKVWGFIRTYEYGQTNNTWLGKCINRALFGDRFSDGKPANPDTYIMISTHFGYGDSDGVWDNQLYKSEGNIFDLNGGKWFNDETIEAFRNLKKRQDKGEILVTRTSRLLKYNLVHDMLTKYANTRHGFTVEKSSAGEKITIHKVHDECFGEFIPEVDDLRGITFYCKNPQTAQIWIGANQIDSYEIQINDKDPTGLRSIGIKWHEQDTTDYTEKRS
jgi:hypothetical protein